jgi:isoamylase
LTTHALTCSPPSHLHQSIKNQKGDVWHVALEGLPGAGVLYGFRVAGQGGWETGYRWDAARVLLDPRAPLVAGRRAWAARDALERFELDVSPFSVW